MNWEDWEPPRCIHGHILLGCPHDDCPTQTAYLDQQEAALAEWEQRQRKEARRLVRRLLGLDPEG
jgi:hypothetical protein